MRPSRCFNALVRKIREVSTDSPFALNEFISVTKQSPSGTTAEWTSPDHCDSESRLVPGVHSLAVKDNIAALHYPTTCASAILQDYKSPFEATVVRQLRQHGMEIVGKTNLDEFGMGSHSLNSCFGPVRDETPYSVGGSSGGSALAVGRGHAHVALGTDTGGSVRLPAAYNGIIGFKPSYGLVSRFGVVPYANSLDTVGIMAADAESIQRILTQVAKYDTQDPTSIKPSVRTKIQVSCAARKTLKKVNNSPPGSLRIGVPVEYNIQELDPVVRDAWTKALTLLEDDGCTIVPVSLPNTKHALSAYYVLAPAEAASNLAKYDGVRYGSRDIPTDGSGHVLYSVTRGEKFGEEVRRRVLLGSYTLSSDAIDNYFIKAQSIRRLVQQDFDRVFSFPNPLHHAEQFNLSDMDESVLLENKLGPSQVDVIICPTAPSTAPTVADLSKQTSTDTYMSDVFTVPASLAGLPAMSTPFPVSRYYQRSGKLQTVGIQIIGQFGDDYQVLKAGKRVDDLLPRGFQAIDQRAARRSGHHHHGQSNSEKETHTTRGDVADFGLRDVADESHRFRYPVYLVRKLIDHAGYDYTEDLLSGYEAQIGLEYKRSEIEQLRTALRSFKACHNGFKKVENHAKKLPQSKNLTTEREVTKDLEVALGAWLQPSKENRTNE